MANASGIAVLTLTKTDGRILNLVQASDTVSGYVETKDLDLGTSANKFLQAIVLDLVQYSNLGNMKLIVKYRRTLSEDLQETAPISVQASDPIYLTQLVPQSRYYRFRFQDDLINLPWKLSKISLFGRPGSKRL